MYTKKEIIIAVLAILFGMGLIYFLPTIENKLSNRKTFESDTETENIKIPEKYVCTSDSNDSLVRKITEATFYLTDENVTRIYTRITETYTKEADYNDATKNVKANLDTEDHTLKTVLDNLNWTVITVEAKNIKEGTTTTYPTEYEELKEYLEQNNYVCTIQYKTS
jgi:hypothetical protein